MGVKDISRKGVLKKHRGGENTGSLFKGVKKGLKTQVTQIGKPPLSDMRGLSLPRWGALQNIIGRRP